VERTVNRYLANDRYIERNGSLYPSDALTEHMAKICIGAQTPFVWKKTAIRLAISKEVVSLSVLITDRGNDPLRKVSAQLIRVELAMWEQLLLQPNAPLCNSELASRSRIMKSTLTTLLDAAMNHSLFIANIDIEDERVTRWTLNPHHVRNRYIRSLLRGDSGFKAS